MHPALREARDFLRFHSDWDDDDCRKAFKVLENLEAHFDCLDRRECYEMYESTTTVVLDSVDIDQVGRQLEAFGKTREQIRRELDTLGIPFDVPDAVAIMHAISRRLQSRYEKDTAAHERIGELFEEVDHHARTTRDVAALDYITDAFEDEDWVVETLAAVAAVREKEAS